MATEPADGGYVCVRIGSEDFEILRRRDDWAEHNGLGDAHWFFRSRHDRPALTWVGVTDLGPLAYVGEFRNTREA